MRGPVLRYLVVTAVSSFVTVSCGLAIHLEKPDFPSRDADGEDEDAQPDAQDADAEADVPADDGAEEAGCGPGLTDCAGSCVDLMADMEHCGRCDRACTAGLHAQPLCASGICDVLCEPGWADPDGDGSCDDDCVPVSDEETCNGVDDNCDGAADEGFPCRMARTVACTAPCGSMGSGLCSLECQVPGPESCTPPDELCNGVDDDCDGACDNGFDCCAGESETCVTTCGVEGTRQCSSACARGPCCAGSEVCGNACDDDCDGLMCRDVRVVLTADNTFEATFDGVPLGSGSNWQTCYEFSTQLSTGTHVLTVHAADLGSWAGLLAGLYVDGAMQSATGMDGWKVTGSAPPDGWTAAGFDDASWSVPPLCTGSLPWGSVCPALESAGAQWVWHPDCLASFTENWYRYVFTLP